MTYLHTPLIKVTFLQISQFVVEHGFLSLSGSGIDSLKRFKIFVPGNLFTLSSLSLFPIPWPTLSDTNRSSIPLHAVDSNPSSASSTSRPTEDMESVVATVSGYHGTERFNLIKLIDHAGASYVGTMSTSITHLVCWKFEGRKFEIAMRSSTVVVNHRWIEDCIKQGKRVPEGPYTLQSGEEVGPLVLEIPQVPKLSNSEKNKKVLSDKTNTSYGFDNQSGYMGFEASGDFLWSRSTSLNEKFLPGTSKHGNSSHKSKRKLAERTSEKELCSSSRSSMQDSPSPRTRWNQAVKTRSHTPSSMDLARDKRNNCSVNEVKPESSHKGRKRLAKKNKSRQIVELLTSDSEQDCYASRVDRAIDEDVVLLSEHIDQAPCESVLGNGQNESLKVDSPNSISLSVDSDIRGECTLTTTEKISKRCTGTENSNKDTTEGLEIRNDSEIPSSKELSCVICLTDFSSTRGVLPCGHRFCYLCIKNWADQMASRGKTSTCPLCKTIFRSILKFEDAATLDQKIYSQTVPCGLLETDMFTLCDQEIPNFISQPELGPVCSVCRRLEPEDLLIACSLCQIRRIHSYCLDPPIDPWTCLDCKELQRLYLLSR